ncbi:hypothetical protein Tco_0722298 [Tanacetum coccineum]
MLSTMNLILFCYKDPILPAGNPVKKILLKLNLSDHRKLKDGGEVFLDVSSMKVKEFSKKFCHYVRMSFSILRVEKCLKLKNFKK